MKWYSRIKGYFYIGPAIFLIVSLIGYGIWMAFLESIKYFYVPSLDVYRDLFSDEQFIASFVYSLRVAMISTFLSILIGLLLVRSAYPKLRNTFPRLIAWIPMLFPHFVWGYMLFLLLSQSGLIPSLLNILGFLGGPKDFPILFKDSFGIGIILTYVWKEIPFVLLMLIPIYEQLSNNRKELVYTLGGNQWSVFWNVERPYVLPVLVETFFIVFAFVISAYEVPALLGATYPKMVSVLTYDWFFGSDWTKQPYAYAAMIVLTITIVVIVFITFLLTKRTRIHLSHVNGETLRNEGERSSSLSSYFFIIGMSLVPILVVVITSFSLEWNFGELLPSRLSNRGWHVLIWHAPQIFDAAIVSIAISVFVLLINLLVGFPAAKNLAFQSYRGKSIVETLLVSPILIPTIVIALGVHLAFIRLGLANHWLGVVLVHLLPTLPYTIKILRAGYERVGKKQEEVAYSLGSKEMSTFSLIYLPQLLPSIRSVVFLVTVISLGQYFITALIGGGEVTTLSILFFPYFQTADDTVIASFSILFAVIPIMIWILVEGALKVMIQIINTR